MAASLVMSISTYVVETLTTVLNTLYSTSTPLLITTVTSTLSQLDTLHYLTTITQPAIVVSSTQATPVTLTETMSTSIIAASVPSAITNTLTTTLTSIVTEPDPTITWYPLPASPFSATITQIAESTSNLSATSTVTITKIALILENNVGIPYTTIVSILPNNPNPTSSVIILLDLTHGWSSWSTSQTAGLIVGIGLFVLIVLLIVACLVRRRRTIWLASEWAPGGIQMVQPTGHILHPR